MSAKKTAIILAGGEGKRAGGKMPKQFHELCGRPMIWWSMKAFHDSDPATQLVLVLHPGFFDDWDIIWNNLPEADRFDYRLCCGGRNRCESVANGLMAEAAVAGDLIAVHDAARPLVSSNLISRCWQTAARMQTAVPVVPVTDSLRKLGADGNSQAVDRSQYVAVQTPQVFDAALLKEAYSKRKADSVYTDDASVVEAFGHNITLCEGEPINIKVTNPADFIVAEALMMAVETKPSE